MATIQELQNIDLFRGLHDEVLQTILGFSDVREFSDGEVILTDQDRSDNNLVIRDLYLLMDGKVNIVKHLQDIDLMKRVNIQAIDNEVYGEIGWLLGSRPSAEITSSGNSRILLVNGKKLFALCESNKDVGYHILYRLAAILAMRLDNQTGTS